MADCAWITTCSGAAHDHLAELVPAASRNKLTLIYHGLDFSRFPAPAERKSANIGDDAANPVVLLSVGRAVEKKGHDILISALALLPAGLHWRLDHIGGGPLLDRLKQQARRQGVAERIDWLGAQPQEKVLVAYRGADLFVLACRIAGDGDRDGLPNVLLEAQSQGLACIATQVSAIPELIEDGITGALVAPDDAAALAGALVSLIGDPARRAALGRAGQNRVRERFSCDDGIVRIARFLVDPTLESTFSTAPPEPEPCALRSTHP